MGEVDDQGELRDLGRVDRRERPDDEPAGRAADDPAEAGDEDEDEDDDRDQVAGQRHQPEVAIVDPHHDEHRQEPSAAHRICGPTIASVSSCWM